MHKLLIEMKEMIGKKDPILFFEKFVEVFDTLFTKIDNLEKKVIKAKNHSALAIKWDPKLASKMLAEEIDKLRENKEVFHSELSAFKQAYNDDIVTQSYDSFVEFWQNVIGEHPFLEY